MKEVGLQPSTTGEPGGKEVGQSVTHYIVPGGPYAHAYAKLAATSFQLNWQSHPFSADRKKKAASKRNTPARYVPQTHGRSRERRSSAASATTRMTARSRSCSPRSRRPHDRRGDHYDMRLAYDNLGNITFSDLGRDAFQVQLCRMPATTTAVFP